MVRQYPPRLLLVGSLAALSLLSGGCSLPLRNSSAQAFALPVPTQATAPTEIGAVAPPASTGRKSRRAQKLVAQASTEYRAGNLSEALAKLRKARQVDSACTTGYALESQIALDQGDKHEAIQMLQATATSQPDNAEIQNRTGALLMQYGAVRSGLLALERAVSLQNSHAGYARDLAAAYVSLHNLPAAEAVLTTALQHNSRDRTLPVALARLNEGEQRWGPARFYFSVAIQNDPGNVDWRRERARCSYRLQDFKHAAADYRYCLDDLLRREAWGEVLEYSHACLQVGDGARARQLFGQVSERGPLWAVQVDQLRRMDATHVAARQAPMAGPVIRPQRDPEPAPQSPFIAQTGAFAP